MKTLVVNRINLVSILTIFCFTLLASFVGPMHPALATEFEVGTQFGISRLGPDEDDSSSITFTHIPTSFMYFGSSPTSLYVTWFPGTQFAIGPEFSFGRMSFSDETETSDITSIYLGGRTAFFLRSHAVSTPYLLGRMSHTIISDEDTFLFGDETMTSFGLGLGYQWRIGTAFVLRTEAQFQRVLVEDDNANEYSLIIGIGTRFGKNEN